MTTQIQNIQIADRAKYRKALASFLGRSCHSPRIVLPYMPSALKGQSPLVVVAGGPTDRQVETPKNYDNSFGFGVRLIVLFNAPAEENWTNEMAEDMLDRLEQEVSLALLLADMQSEAQDWRHISRQGASVFDMVKDGGLMYLTETIPVIMEVDDAQE